MKLAFTYDDHHNAGAEWEKRELKDWLTDVFDLPALKIQPRKNRPGERSINSSAQSISDTKTQE